jgi:selenocysteine lyase/cysteine desulfurase
MNLTRRAALSALGVLPTVGRSLIAGGAGAKATLPDEVNFPIRGVYLDAAFTHPLGHAAFDAAADYLNGRHGDPQSVSPRHNARNIAAEKFAKLINASPADIAVVPSTLEAENLVNASLGTGTGAGVVTDAGHYDGALALYGELQRRGMPLGVVRPREGRIDLGDVRSLLTRSTRLIAVSLVSSTTGFMYDLEELCALAHKHGAWVYADLIQAAGAIPIDVKASGVDFAGCGTYKWLMGDFGCAFLYVRPDRLDQLKRVQVGWRTLRNYQGHSLPLEPPGPVLGTYALAGGAAGKFEVSTPAWGSLAVAAAALDYIAGLGMNNIVRHRQPLLDGLRDALPTDSFLALTPKGSMSPVLSFACRGAQARFAQRLQQENIRISLYENRIRISPSVYNTEAHIDQVVGVLRGRSSVTGL